MPKKKKEIVPINLQVYNLVKTLEVESIFESLKNITEETDVDALIEGLIKNEMEN